MSETAFVFDKVLNREIELPGIDAGTALRTDPKRFSLVLVMVQDARHGQKVPMPKADAMTRVMQNPERYAIVDEAPHPEPGTSPAVSSSQLHSGGPIDHEGEQAFPENLQDTPPRHRAPNKK